MEKFNYEVNGYNKAEVNRFVDDVIVQTEAVIKRVRTQSSEITKLRDEITRYRRQEETLRNALIKAEEASVNIKRQAFDESKIVVEEARKNASRVINDALLRAERIELKADNLERNIRIFKKKLKLVIEQQLTVIDEIEELELR